MKSFGEGREGGGGGKERIDEVWNLGTKFKAMNTHASQRYLQAAEDLRCYSRYCEQIFEDRESFLLQMTCVMSSSVELYSFARDW